MSGKPEQLRRRAAEKRAMALRLEAEADALDLEASQIEAARERERGLTAGLQSGTVKPMNVAERKIRSKAAVDPADEFMVAVHVAFPSLRAFAKKAGVSAQFLSQVRSGVKHMPTDLAERIERLIGFPASRWR